MLPTGDFGFPVIGPDRAPVVRSIRVVPSRALADIVTAQRGRAESPTSTRPWSIHAQPTDCVQYVDRSFLAAPWYLQRSTALGDYPNMPSYSRDDHDDPAIGIQLSFRTIGGLSAVYNGHRTEPSDYPYWEPITIAGYPAVRESLADDRDIGFCSVDIGVSDEVIATVSISGMDNEARCYRQLTAAGAAVVDGIRR